MPTRTRRVTFVAFFIGLVSVGCQSNHAADRIEPIASHSYVARLQNRVGEWQHQLDAIRASASAAAEKAIAGGRVYYGGPQKSFGPEACGRSGGLYLAQYYHPKVELAANDTIVTAFAAGSAAQDLQALLDRAGAAGATVVLFGDVNLASTQPSATTQPTIQRLPAKRFAEAPAGASGLSIESLSNIIGMWTWNAEFVAACVRLGKTPCMYESYGMPGGRERDAQFQKQSFHAVRIVKPDDVKDLGARYLSAIASSLQRMHDDNGDAFQRAAKLMKSSHAAGGAVRVTAEGHMYPPEITVPQNPAWITLAKADDKYTANDTAIVLGYQPFPTDFVAKLPTGCAAIVTTPHLPTAEFLADAKHVYINPLWQVQDAAVEIRGYDVKVFPMSGILQGAVYWQLVELATGTD